MSRSVDWFLGARMKSKFLIIAVFSLVGIALLLSHNYMILTAYAISLVVLEIISFALVKHFRKDFPWLITPEDDFPELSKDGLKKFIEHGYDPELGWVRKPGTGKEEIGKFGKSRYNIDKSGSRKNPGHEKLPKKISFYGDSFIFGRQVNDNETCQWYLSELTKTNVTNFSVGNYGLDQALLRLKREYRKNRTKVVVMGVVPSTIVRILSVWKHYNEFGNTFGFKPRFIIEKGKLKLIRNFIDSEGKFSRYRQYLPEIRKYDYFYNAKFKKEMIRFPYFISLISDPFRNIPLICLILKNKVIDRKDKLQAYPAPMKVIMDINLKLRRRIFEKDKESVRLLEELIGEFSRYAKSKKFVPVFLLMPQKDDLLLIRDREKEYYRAFISRIRKKLDVIDLTEDLVSRDDLDEIFSDDTKYGGHYSRFGNELVAGILYEKMKEKKII